MAVGAGISTDLRPVAGARLGVASAGIKTPGKQDLTLIQLDTGTALAGVFTQNRFCAAPVVIARQHVEQQNSGPKALLINTGNANCGTGDRGFDDAMSCCQAVADELGWPVESVLPFSTGVIGEYLPMERLTPALPELVSSVGTADWYTAARTILTTDTRSKGHSVVVHLGEQAVTITGISKGSGMICPNMATMLGFVCTDAQVDQAVLQSLLNTTNEQSFNRITVDGDTSTNDACILAATGASGVALNPDQPGWNHFANAVQEVMRELALQIIRDGEGASKIVAIGVHGAATTEDALAVAYTVAHSPLVKTAMAASDANWGRILAAVGRAPVEALDLSQVNIRLDDVPLVTGGKRDAEYEEAQGAAVFAQSHFSIHIDIGSGEVTETVWTSDLTHEYVSINADYRT